MRNALLISFGCHVLALLLLVWWPSPRPVRKPLPVQLVKVVPQAQPQQPRPTAPPKQDDALVLATKRSRKRATPTPTRTETRTRILRKLEDTATPTRKRRLVQIPTPELKLPTVPPIPTPELDEPPQPDTETAARGRNAPRGAMAFQTDLPYYKYAGYASALRARIERKWTGIAPRTTTQATPVTLSTRVRFSIAPDGRIFDVAAMQLSGSAVFDEAAVQTVQDVGNAGAHRDIFGGKTISVAVTLEKTYD